MEKHTFSLIVATYGREKELDRLLDSLAHQSYDMSLVEIYIVDQNDNIDLVPILQKYRNQLNIQHIKSTRKGTSYNRNIGIEMAKGHFLAFPDDDSTYYPDTLEKVNDYFLHHSQIDCCLGRIYDRVEKKNILRNWSEQDIKINMWNFFKNYSEIVMFVRSGNVNHDLFSNYFGPGEYFGSCEGIDYLVAHFLKRKRKVMYTPEVEVWHPVQQLTSFDAEKVTSYGLGFGAFCCKNCSLPILILYVETIVYHSIKWIIALLTFNTREAQIRKSFITARIKGWIQWRNSSRGVGGPINGI